MVEGEITEVGQSYSLHTSPKKEVVKKNEPVPWEEIGSEGLADVLEIVMKWMNDGQAVGARQRFRIIGGLRDLNIEMSIESDDIRTEFSSPVKKISPDDSQFAGSSDLLDLRLDKFDQKEERGDIGSRLYLRKILLGDNE